MKKRIEKWLKETMAIACLLLIAMPMTASKKVLFDKMKGQYRIPAIVQCKSGKIIAFTDHRYDGTDIGWWQPTSTVDTAMLLWWQTTRQVNCCLCVLQAE